MTLLLWPSFVPFVLLVSPSLPCLLPFLFFSSFITLLLLVHICLPHQIIGSGSSGPSVLIHCRVLISWLLGSIQ